MRKSVVGIALLVGAVGAAAMAQLAIPPGEPPKDPEPPIPGPGPRVPCPGPDGFGYFCDDTVPFVDVDITETASLVVSGDDGAWAVTLGGAYPFDFYGNEQLTMTMTTNGYLSTDAADDGSDFSNDCPIPSPPSSGGGGRLYPLHDDLVLDADGGYYEYFNLCPRPVDRPGLNSGCHVFMWSAARHFGTPSGPFFDLWAFLYDTYDITFQVGAGNPERGLGSTTGIQSPSAADGLLYACNSGESIPDGFAITLFHPNPNLTVPTMSAWAVVALILALGVIGLASLGIPRRPGC